MNKGLIDIMKEGKITHGYIKYCIDCGLKLHTTYFNTYNDKMGWCRNCFPKGKISWEKIRAR